MIELIAAIVTTQAMNCEPIANKPKNKLPPNKGKTTDAIVFDKMFISLFLLFVDSI